MKQKTLIAITGTLIALVIIVIAALIANKKAEPEVETEPEIPVQMSIEKETADEQEETTTAAVVRATEPVTVAPTETTEAETEHSYTVEELADYVLNNGINGPEREEVLGDRYEEVQAWINENHVPPVRYEEPAYDSEPVYYEGGDVLTPGAGVNYYNGRMETYYNLPMGGVLDIMYSLGYDGEYWVRGDGVKMFGPYVMVAADFSQYPRGTILDCSLGTAIVCDTGAGGWNWLDIAVTW